MKLKDKEIGVGDTVYSESMGYGSVIAITSSSVLIDHHGQNWRYTVFFVRQGCKRADLSWRPKSEGLQLKDQKEYDAAKTILEGVAKLLSDNHGKN